MSIPNPEPPSPAPLSAEATGDAGRTFPALAGLLRAVLDVIRDVQGPHKSKLIVLVLLTGLAGFALASSQAHTGILVLALVGAIALLLVIPRQIQAIIGAVAVLLFGLAASYRDGPSLPVAQPVAPDARSREKVAVEGWVRIQGSAAPVPGAIVQILNHATEDTTDGTGYFRLEVERYKLKGDTVWGRVRTDTLIRFHHTPVGEEFTVPVPPRRTAAVRTAGGELARLAALRVQDTSRTASLRFILDSIRTLHDGSSGPSTWTFTVNVNDTSRIRLGRASYDKSRDQGVLLVGGETQVEAPEGMPLSLEVSGTRDGWFFLQYRARGVRSFPPEAIPAGGRVPVELRVTERYGAHEGDFRFFFTVVRPAAQAMQPPPWARRGRRGGGSPRAERSHGGKARGGGPDHPDRPLACSYCCV